MNSGLRINIGSTSSGFSGRGRSPPQGFDPLPNQRVLFCTILRYRILADCSSIFKGAFCFGAILYWFLVIKRLFVCFLTNLPAVLKIWPFVLRPQKIIKNLMLRKVKGLLGRGQNSEKAMKTQLEKHSHACILISAPDFQKIVLIKTSAIC